MPRTRSSSSSKKNNTTAAAIGAGALTPPLCPDHVRIKARPAADFISSSLLPSSFCLLTSRRLPPSSFCLLPFPAWVQHFIHHLAPHGMAGFGLANGSMSSNQSGEGDIRRALIEADLVGSMLVARPASLSLEGTNS